MYPLCRHAFNIVRLPFQPSSHASERPTVTRGSGGQGLRPPRGRTSDFPIVQTELCTTETYTREVGPSWFPDGSEEVVLASRCVGHICSRIITHSNSRPRFLRTIHRIFRALRPIIRGRPRCRGTNMLRHVIRPRHAVGFHIT